MKCFIILIILTANSVFGGEKMKTNQIRTYMSYSWPLDPAKIVTLPDMDLSYALAGTLSEWSPNKELISGLAKRWDSVSEKVIRVQLKPDAKWSDGKSITSNDIKASLERGIKVHPTDLRSLNDLIEKMVCPDSKTIEFHLKTSTKDSNLMAKLTEPNYGVLKISSGDKIDLSISSGAFYVSKSDEKELVLRKNTNWIHDSKPVVDEVVVRQPSTTMNPQTILLEDEWPNLTLTSSMMAAGTMKKYESGGYTLWNRTTDRIFLFQLSPRLHNKVGLDLFKFLDSKLDKSKIVGDFSGARATDQIFPKGLHLYLSDYKHAIESTAIPKELSSRPLEILISPARVSDDLRESIRKAITSATGTEPKFISVPIQEVFKKYKEGSYDFYAGTVGLADPDIEGVMSFYFENEFRIIPSISYDFVKRLDTARKETDLTKRKSMMRDMIRDALLTGHVLPLFHLSTVGIARTELELSQIPSTDESVTLSRVRLK